MRKYLVASPLLIVMLTVLIATLAPTRGRGEVHVLPPGCRSVSYPTYHFDNGRTGWNPHETLLNAGNVRQLTLIADMTVNGMVDAQPLVAACQAIEGRTMDLLIVATENNRVYAFNANSGAPVWETQLDPPVKNSGCNGGRSSIGIMSTPTIDTNTGVLYAVDYTGTAHNASYILHEISLKNGRSIRSVTVVPKLSSPHFSANTLHQRPALLENEEKELYRHEIYVALGSQCELASADDHGWLIAYNANTLAQDGAFATTQDDATPEPPCAPTPNPFGPGTFSDKAIRKGSIWQSGFGIAGDGDTWFVTGNGSFTADTTGKDFSQSILHTHLATNRHQPTGLVLKDWFAPENWCPRDIGDADLGTSGVVLIPRTSKVTMPLAAIEDHWGTLYIVNRLALGRTGRNGVYYAQLARPPGSGLWGGPVSWTGPDDAPRIAVPRNDAAHKEFGLQIFTITQNGSTISVAPGYVLGSKPETYSGESGNTPIVTSNGRKGGYLLWLMTRPAIGFPILLEAFDPEADSDQPMPLVSIPLTRRGPGFGSAGQYWSPTVVNGHVYAISYGKLGFATSTAHVYIFALDSLP